MPRLTIVRYATKPGRADENEALSRAVFAELRQTQPNGVAYTLCRDGDAFTHVFINFADDSSDAVTDLPSFKAFSADAPDRYTAPPETIRASVDMVEAYGFERTPAPVA